MVLIGQAALKSPAFNDRLSALLGEFQELGCTVWLEGMTLRFDVPESLLGWVQAGGVGALLARYRDVVTWLPDTALLDAELLNTSLLDDVQPESLYGIGERPEIPLSTLKVLATKSATDTLRRRSQTLAKPPEKLLIASERPTTRWFHLRPKRTQDTPLE